MMEISVTADCDTDDFSVLMSTQNTTEESKLGSEEQHSLVYLYVTFMIHELTNCVRVDKSIV